MNMADEVREENRSDPPEPLSEDGGAHSGKDLAIL